MRAGHRRKAGRAAAMAAAGRGAESAMLADEMRTSLRQQAAIWLRADLVQLAKMLEGGKPEDRRFVLVELWEFNRDLADISKTEHFQELPDAEQAAWELLLDYARMLRECAETPVQSRLKS